MGKSGTRHSSPIRKLLRKLGLEDSRRIIHSLKVGLALTLASLLVLVNQPYHWIGKNAIWAVITVVVVFEASAGATLSKGLNRGLGTVLAGILALGAAHLADLHVSGEPVLIGSMVFISGSVCTFMRAIPKVKKKFDYGVVIFMATFCMVLVTGYRTGDEVKRATDRLLTIVIGGLISLAVSSFIFPHWAGKDLHRLTANNFDKLGNALEECVKEYLSGEAQFITSKMIADDADPVYSTCREAVKSRNTQEALVVFASWEPPHGRFRLGYPWKQYLTVGAMLRHCAYSVLALHGCLRSEIQAPSGLRIIFAKEMLTASRDAADLLHELGGCIRNMQKPKDSTKCLLKKISNSAEDIKRSITKHSYLLASPESWAALENSVHESRTTTRFASENETVLSKSKLGNSTQIQPEVPHYQRRFTKHSKRIHAADYSTEESSLVKTVDSLQLHEQHEKDGPLPRLINAPKLHALLEDEVLQSGSVDRPTSSQESTTSSQCSVSGTDERSTRSRVEDIAGAASLISFASLLIETLARLDHVVEAVQTLSQSGRFRASTGGPSRVHVEEHCIPVCDEECKGDYSRMEEISKTSISSQNWKTSRNLTTNAIETTAE